MAIKITTSYHEITVPYKLKERLLKLVETAAIAKYFGHNELYNNLQHAYDGLRNQWLTSAGEIAKKNTRTNWLGGGDVYHFDKCDYWGFIDSIIQAYSEKYTKIELINLLNNYLLDLRDN